MVERKIPARTKRVNYAQAAEVNSQERADPIIDEILMLLFPQDDASFGFEPSKIEGRLTEIKVFLRDSKPGGTLDFLFLLSQITTIPRLYERVVQMRDLSLEEWLGGSEEAGNLAVTYQGMAGALRAAEAHGGGNRAS